MKEIDRLHSEGRVQLERVVKNLDNHAYDIAHEAITINEFTRGIAQCENEIDKMQNIIYKQEKRMPTQDERNVIDGLWKLRKRYIKGRSYRKSKMLRMIGINKTR